MDGRLNQERWLSERMKAALAKLAEEGVISEEAATSLPIEIETPKDAKFGDFSFNTAMKLAKAAGLPPRELAAKLAAALPTAGTPISKLEIAGPGFINVFLDVSAYQAELVDMLSKGEGYGSIALKKEKSINVEFVSANPTGPIHLGNARGGAVGDAIANIYAKAGWKVTKEFYINDAGNQVKKFGESLSARYMQHYDPNYPFPEDGYKGDDVTALAEAYRNAEGDGLVGLSEDERAEALSAYGLKKNIQGLHDDLDAYGVHYDVWFSESQLHEGPNDAALELLRRNGAIYEKDGAVWFRASDYGSEKDEVLVRSNGIATYYLADIAYHYDKLAIRGFDVAVNVWGADHHGHIQRMRSALSALGIDPGRLIIILIQLVHLMEGEEAVRLSKRAGQIVTLSALIEEVGTDAARFIFNFSSPNTHMDFDLGLAVRESNENPVFYVQYAHARMCSILRNVPCPPEKLDPYLLEHASEIALLKKLCEYSKEVYQAAIEFDPSRMTRYAYSLASQFHSFYNAVRVKTDDGALTRARLALVEASAYVLRSALGLIGVAAPEQM